MTEPSNSHALRRSRCQESQIHVSPLPYPLAYSHVLLGKRAVGTVEVGQYFVLRHA